MKQITFAWLFLVGLLSLALASETADDVVARVSAKLSAAPKAFASSMALDQYNVGLTSLVAELSLFEARYGVPPEETKGWAAVKAQSLSLLKQLDAGKKKPTDLISATTRALLLELGGHYAEALRCYSEIKPAAFCGDFMLAIAEQNDLRRSVLYEKLGDKTNALSALDAAFAARDFAFQFPNPDIHSVRHGLLSLNAGNASIGVADLQKVVDLYPHTPGWEVAREKLEQRHQLIAPTAARLKHVYLSPSSDFAGEAIKALGTYRFPDSFETLRDLLETGPSPHKERVISALGALGDQRAVALLLADFRRGSDFTVQFCDLVAMARLGDYKLLRPFFERVGQANPEQGYPLGYLNDQLRLVFGGGPRFTIPDLMKPADFSAQWLAWLQKHAPESIAPTTSQTVTKL